MNTIRELKQEEKYNNMLKRKNKEIERLQEDIGNYVNIVLHERKEIDRLNNLLKETSQTLSKQTTKAITLKSENKRLKNVIKRITEINNQKIKIINDIIEYMNTNVNANINHIYEILEGDKK